MRPAQTMQHTPHMISIVANAEHLLDQRGHPRCRPKISPIPICQRSPKKLLDQPAPLCLRQFSRATRRTPHAEGCIPALGLRISPPHHRTGVAPYNPRYFTQGPSLAEQAQRPPPPPFQFPSAPSSTHTCSPPNTIVALFTQKSIRVSPRFVRADSRLQWCWMSTALFVVLQRNATEEKNETL